jgi:threonine dehydratase
MPGLLLHRINSSPTINPMKLLQMDEIKEASDFIKTFIWETPLEESAALSSGFQSQYFLKLENLQRTGSFKLRGALFKLGKLKAEGTNSVITCSAGNHGWALAWAGRQFDCRVEVFVPSSADESKCLGISALGAKVIKCPTPGYDDAEKIAIDAAKSRNIPFISPYDDYQVMAGNGGSLAAEILDQLPGTGSIFFPVGGGGLGAGIASYIKRKNPGIKLIGCQHIDSPALALSLERGHAVTTLPAIQTIAGGIEGGIGIKTFEILRDTIDQIVLVSEDELKKSILWMLKNHQHLVEASGAAAVAACLFHRDDSIPSPSVLILTGRNISFSTLTSVIEEMSPVS